MSPCCCSPTIASPAMPTTGKPLKFAPFTMAEMPRVRRLLAEAPARTCDFTVGGLYMWTDYFRYRRAFVADETGEALLVRGVSERDVTRTAYSLPVGTMPLHRAIALLRRHCEAAGEPLLLSAVPESAVASLTALGARVEAELTDWADYLYDASALATYSGKKMSKKRNHFNAFSAAYPAYTFEPLTEANARAVIDFYSAMELPETKGVTAEVERLQTLRVLSSLPSWPFRGAVLSTPRDGIVAFTIGEVKDDTLYVHIEKMRHDIPGAGETVSHLFAAYIVDRCGIAHINREEDAGDEGLRRSKLSYHPAALLRKYDLTF